MALHLIAMRVHAAKVVRTPVDVKHDTLAALIVLLPCVVIAPHLDPLCPEIPRRSSPLPPFLPPDAFDAPGAQLFDDGICSSRQILLGHRVLLDLDPVRRRHPLGGEALDILDGEVGGVEEELADDVQTLVVGETGGGFLKACLAVHILDRQSAAMKLPAWVTLWVTAAYMGDTRRDDGRGHREAQTQRVQGHRDGLLMRRELESCGIGARPEMESVEQDDAAPRGSRVRRGLVDTP